MTPTQTALIIIAAVFIMVMIAVAVQTAENQRRERHLRVLALRDQVRRSEHLLANLPSEFQSLELRTLLITYLRALWREITQLERRSDPSEALEKLNQLEEAGFTPPPFPANSATLFPERNSALRSRALVREMAELLNHMSKSGAVKESVANYLLQEMKHAYIRCNCDLIIHDANASLEVTGARVAIHQLRTAHRQLQKLNLREKLDAQMFALNTLIEETEARAQNDLLAQQAAEKAARDAEEKRKRMPGTLF